MITEPKVAMMTSWF